jgi:hypothetical protein
MMKLVNRVESSPFKLYKHRRAHHIYFNGTPIQKSYLWEEANATLDAHRIRTMDERRVLEALLFTYATKIQESKRVFSCIINTHGESEDNLWDAEWWLDRPEKPFVIKRDQPLEETLIYRMLDMAQRYRGNMVDLANRFLADPVVVREELCELPGVGPKVASLFYLVIGGREQLLTMDRHIYKIFYGFGLDVPEKVGDPQPRTTGVNKGRRIPEALGIGKYREIEESALKLFATVDGFHEGKVVDSSFATALFWLAGRRRSRKTLYHYVRMFGKDEPFVVYPFSDYPSSIPEEWLNGNGNEEQEDKIEDEYDSGQLTLDLKFE